MKEKLPFHSYQGDEPYLFVSYAHKDAEKVYDVIGALHAQRCRIWYDEGIEVGANWPQTVAEHLRGAAAVVFFISGRAVLSQNCRREINYAVSQKKNCLVVRLDDSELPPDMAMQLSVAPEIRAQDTETIAAELANRLDDSLIGDGVTGYGERNQKQKKPVNGWLIASLVLTLLLFGAALGFFGVLNGWFGVKQAIRREEISTETRGEIVVTTFNSSLSLELLLRSLDGESVYLCGNAIVSDALAIERTEAGWAVNGETMARGPVDSFAPFAGETITQLALVNENLSSLEGVEALPSLRYLDLSDNPVSDLTPLKKLEQLQTLRVLSLPEGTDLAPLAALPALRQVTVSYDMIDRIAPLVEAGIDVIVNK